MSRIRPDAILIDLFDTLVSIDARRLPRRVVDGREYVVTIANLEELLAEMGGEVSVKAFYDALWAVSAELAEEKGRTHKEIPSRERFLRTLARLGAPAGCERLAEELSRRHMETLTGAVVCPEGRSDLLETLGSRYRLALVSNFDDGPAARRLLGRHRLEGHFDAVLISEEVGQRKPAAGIFLEACRALGVEPGRALHVGDSYRDDVCGAAAAGLDAVWIDSGDGDPAPALARLADLAELPAWLDATIASR